MWRMTVSGGVWHDMLAYSKWRGMTWRSGGAWHDQVEGVGLDAFAMPTYEL